MWLSFISCKNCFFFFFPLWYAYMPFMPTPQPSCHRSLYGHPRVCSGTGALSVWVWLPLFWWMPTLRYPMWHSFLRFHLAQLLHHTHPEVEFALHSGGVCTGCLPCSLEARTGSYTFPVSGCQSVPRLPPLFASTLHHRGVTSHAAFWCQRGDI